MKKKHLLLSFGLFALISFLFMDFKKEEPQKPIVCLAMVVKNNESTIQSCLDSIKDKVDCLSICDSGSTDNTLEIVRAFMQKNDVLGKVYKYHLQNVDQSFYNTLAVQSAKKTILELGFELTHSYIVFLEPHQQLKEVQTLDKGKLKDAAYRLTLRGSDFNSHSTLLLDPTFLWENVGLAYPYWTYNNEPFKSAQLLQEWFIEDPKTDKQVELDIQLLERGLKEEPENSRYVFYLAHSHRFLNHYDEAIKRFDKRIQMGGDKEEIWCSKYYKGYCYEILGKWDQAFPLFLEAYQDNVYRAEPLYRIAKYFRAKGANRLGYVFAKQGIPIPYPVKQNLFISSSIYDYQFDEELSLLAYFSDSKEAGLAAVNHLMLKKNVPNSLKEQANKNLFFYLGKIKNTTFTPTEVSVSIPSELSFISKSSLDSGRAAYDFSRLRSAGSPLKWNQGHILNVYEVVIVDGKSHYIHRFLEVDKNLNVKGITKPFVFQYWGRESSGKMAYDSTKKKIIVPVTVENSSTSIATIDVETIQNMLEPLEMGPEIYQLIIDKPKSFEEFKVELKKSISSENVKQNPFHLKLPEKENLTKEDYSAIQAKLKTIKVDALLDELYPADQGYSALKDFDTRCKRALNQKLIDPEKGLLPSKQLIKIGKGGDRCIVSFCSYNGSYENSIKAFPQALEESGFNGYFLFQVGGYPNPTGQEIQFAGVPYCFKIFMLMEAYKLGFNHVLWVDALTIPVQGLDSVFTQIEEKGAYIIGWDVPNYNWRYLFPKTRELLKDKTGTDVANKMHVYSIVFGMKMNTGKAQNFIKEYYQMAALGKPFLSCYPEEFVFSALLGQSKYAEWEPKLFHQLFFPLEGNEDEVAIKKIKADGYYFLLRKH